MKAALRVSSLPACPFPGSPAAVGTQWDDLQPPGAGSVPTVMGDLPEAALPAECMAAHPGERCRPSHCHNSHQEKSQAATSSGGIGCPVGL